MGTPRLLPSYKLPSLWRLFMPRKLGLLLTVGVLIVPLLGSAPSLAQTAPPPPLQAEVVPAPPPPGAVRGRPWVWQPGYWRWNGANHVWVGGYWTYARPGYRYVPARWARTGPAWRFHAGYWAR